MQNKQWKYFIGTVSLTTVFTTGIFLGRFVYNKPLFVASQEVNKDIRHETSGSWRFINPLLDCGELNNVSNKTILSLKNKVGIYINTQKDSGSIDFASIYFRDLNNGPWFGVSEKEKFYPASLLKVPLMISILTQAMDDPIFLGKQLVWQGEGTENNQYFKAIDELKNNQMYTVGEALAYMIKYSDNNAADLLTHSADPLVLSKSYLDLGLEFPKDQNYKISTKDYASFFRILYNSTFLNKEYSEDALHLLSDTVFNAGLVKKLPSSVKVSHKFGERTISDGEKYLHDCGIVYEENTPYILCVMTKGSDFEQMAGVIADVSRIVYEGVRGGRLNSR